MSATILIETIGTFDVLDEKVVVPFAVRDRCEFNNWGAAFFNSKAEAIAYAAWAHSFKTGRTTSEFREFHYHAGA